MLNTALLAAFIPTMFVVSITPGMCMTLALSLGMLVGVRRTGWMMLGELIGVAAVAITAAYGVAVILLGHPTVFMVLKYLGGAWLVWLGIQLWRSRGHLSLNPDRLVEPQTYGRWQLASQGFTTAVVNPKGWAFMVALLPAFIDHTLAFEPQLAALVGIITVVELICLVLYAAGGRSLRHFLEKRGNVQRINRVTGTLMIGVGIWLALS